MLDTSDQGWGYTLHHIDDLKDCVKPPEPLCRQQGPAYPVVRKRTNIGLHTGLETTTSRALEPQQPAQKRTPTVKHSGRPDNEPMGWDLQVSSNIGAQRTKGYHKPWFLVSQLYWVVEAECRILVYMWSFGPLTHFFQPPTPRTTARGPARLQEASRSFGPLLSSCVGNCVTFNRFGFTQSVKANGRT